LWNKQKPARLYTSPRARPRPPHLPILYVIIQPASAERQAIPRRERRRPGSSRDGEDEMIHRFAPAAHEADRARALPSHPPGEKDGSPEKRNVPNPRKEAKMRGKHGRVIASRCPVYFYDKNPSLCIRSNPPWCLVLSRICTHAKVLHTDAQTGHDNTHA